MSKRGGKVAVVQKTMKDPELIDMFNKMVGASDPDPNIVIPKYERIHNNAFQVIKLLEKFLASPPASVFKEQFIKSFEQIQGFVATSAQQLRDLSLEENDNIMSGEELKAINSDPEKMMAFLANVNSKYKVAGLGDKYNKLQNSPVIKEMIMVARNLKNAVMLEQDRAKLRAPPKEKGKEASAPASATGLHNLECKESLSEDFILHSEGDFLTLFNFTTLDFKQMFYSDLMTKQFKTYILLFLHFIYVRVMAIVKDITSPNVDVDKFSEIVVRNIDEMRKHIPRCDKAFDKIKASVSLLKDNFGGYYKSFVTSQNGNPGIIVENFVLDVAKKNSADVQTTRQFRQIINFYHKQISSKKVSDPKVRKMLSLVGENLDILETRMDRKAATPANKKSSVDDNDINVLPTNE
jgi:hypothetical protein